MTPTWYDVLDVEPDATADEIRAAWKSSIADLDPGDRRFRTLNQAAEVLLDPTRRAAYDRDLAAQAAPEDDTVEEQADVPTLVPDPAEEPTSAAAPSSPRSTWVVPAWILVPVAVLAAALVVAAVLLAGRSSDETAADDVRAAQAAAERAVTPVLSYDAADLEGSRSAAASYLTSSYEKERDKLFDDVIDPNAPNTGTKVVTSVNESSVRATGDGRVEVFLFVDQATTNKEQPEPQILRTWVTMTMEKVDDEWLVGDMRVID